MAVAPAECKFSLFREKYWAAASWAVEHSSAEAGPDADKRDLCKPVRRLSLKQELHVKSIEKLDLGGLPREDEKPTEELQARREKFAFFEKHCSNVYEGIYLGSDLVARNRQLLADNGVTHVVNCVGFLCSNYHAGQLAYKTLYLQDAPTEDITCIFYEVFDYIQAALEAGGRVYLHCSQGVSRSATVVIAYLMYRLNLPYDEVYRMVKQQRGVTNPNIGFTCQLLQWHKRRNSPVEPGTPRVYQVVPQSAWASSFLVPKQVKDGHLGCLDPRGAFVCHTSAGLYTWTGSACPAPMAAAAERIAQQLRRYEGIGADPSPVAQGAEPSEFLEAMSRRTGGPNGQPPPPVGDGSWAPAEVRAYDKAYEMYKEAANKPTAVGGGSSGVGAGGAVSGAGLPAAAAAGGGGGGSSDTPRSNPKTPRDDPDPSEGSPNHRSRKALRSHGSSTPRGEHSGGA